MRFDNETRCAGSRQQCIERARPAAGGDQHRPEAGVQDALYATAVQSSELQILGSEASVT